MEPSSKDSQSYKLESQLREEYGRVAYSYMAHEKASERLTKRDSQLKTGLLVCNAMSSTGFATTILGNNSFGAVLGGIFAVISLFITTYQKSFNLLDAAKVHKTCAIALWKVREEYVSLLTDFESLSSQEIATRRDNLQNQTFQIYQNVPSTSKKDYAATRKALQPTGNHTFSDEEIDALLPNAIRRKPQTNS